jgi:hypothetical protein
MMMRREASSSRCLSAYDDDTGGLCAYDDTGGLCAETSTRVQAKRQSLNSPRQCQVPERKMRLEASAQRHASLTFRPPPATHAARCHNALRENKNKELALLISTSLLPDESSATTSKRQPAAASWSTCPHACPTSLSCCSQRCVALRCFIQSGVPLCLTPPGVGKTGGRQQQRTLNPKP